MGSVRRLYVDGPFGQMHLRCARAESSKQPPLICFHQSPISGRIYERFLEAVSPHRQAIAVDTPGFGMSDPPPSPPTIADYGRAMWAAIAALEIVGPIDLMGYHTGSMIAAELAAEHPQDVRRIVLVSAPLFTDEERAELRRVYAPETVTADGSHLAKTWMRYVHHHRSRSLEDLADMFPDRLLGRNISWWGHQAAFDFDLEARLREVSQPVLVLNPDDDLQVESRRAASLLRHGQLVELPDWGHGFLDAHTADAATLVESFLDAPEADPFGALAKPSRAAA